MSMAEARLIYNGWPCQSCRKDQHLSLARVSHAPIWRPQPSSRTRRSSTHPSLVSVPRDVWLQMARLLAHQAREPIGGCLPRPTCAWDRTNGPHRPCSDSWFPSVTRVSTGSPSVSSSVKLRRTQVRSVASPDDGMAVTLACPSSLDWARESGCIVTFSTARCNSRWRNAVTVGGSSAYGKCSRGSSRVVMNGGQASRRSWRQGFRPPRIPVLDSYLLSEMVPPFLVALGVGTTLGLSLGTLVGLVRQVVASGLPLRVALTAATLHVPLYVSQMLPPACMAASLFGLGRLKADNEITALAASGVPFWRMLVAPICLSALAALLKLACNDYLVPLSSSHARNMVQEALTTNIQSLRQTEDVVYPEYGKLTLAEKQAAGKQLASSKSDTVLRRIWYAERMKGGCISGLLLLEVAPSGQVERVVLAESCEWDQASDTWNFVKCSILPVSHQALSRLLFQVGCLQVTSRGIAPRKLQWSSSPQEFSRTQFLDHIAHLEAEMKSKDGGITEAPVTTNNSDTTGTVPLGVWSAVKSQMAAKMKVWSNIRSPPPHQLAVTRAWFLFLRRDAAAVSCGVYGLVGATSTLALSTSSILPSKSRAVPFVVAFLGALVYSGLTAVFGAAGYAGFLHPIVCAWIPVPFGILLGVSMFWLLK